MLFLIAYQWEVNALFFLFIMVAVIASKRWGVFGGFGMSLFVLMALAFLTNSGWGLPYLRAVLSDWYDGAHLNLNSYVSLWFSNSKLPIASIIAVALSVIVLLEWINALRSNFRHIVWAASLSLAVTPLLGFAIFESNYVVLILPFFLALALAWERWRPPRFHNCASIRHCIYRAVYFLRYSNVRAATHLLRSFDSSSTHRRNHCSLLDALASCPFIAPVA
ncbi:MAG: hypothetical protein U0X87_00020 [Anaerolineales bacterium]